MKKLILTGTHGSGKTTLLNHYKDLGYNVITEVVRNLSKEGVNINEMGDAEGQEKIFNTYLDLLDSEEGYISDRGLTDVAGYTFALCVDGKIDKEVADEQFLVLQKFHQDHPEIEVCYVPIEFPVVDDGVRSTDESFRERVDFMIKNLLDCAEVKYHTVSGTVEERIKQIDNILNS